MNSLRELMEKELKAQGDLRMIGRGAEYEKYPYADPSGKNFYERYMSGEEMNTGWVNKSDFRGQGEVELMQGSRFKIQGAMSFRYKKRGNS